MSEKRVTIQGASIRYLEEGSGEPILLLPSSAGRATEYQELIPLLSRRLHVYAVDYPGFGRSDPLPGIEGTEDLAAFILGWLDAVGLRKTHLVGFSLGGWISLLLALAHPERIEALILIATSAGRLPDVPIVSPSGMNFKEILDRFYHRNEVREKLARQRRTLEEREEVLRSSQALARLVKQKKIIPELHHRLKEIRLPTLILSADHDRAIPPVYQERLHSGILSSKRATFIETGHAIVAERPDELAAEILTFIEENPPVH
ncbi:MAG: alpha/beta hydrolase [Nitrospirae bacterium]|nr:alpha/beta hydrolase [Candidatus Manganitrophaceae bacterium]